MNTLTIKLKQHTPLIHFQHDQEGATLRASEVKPKLDKYVLTKLGNGNYQAGIELAKDKGWLIGKGDHPALDYKMKIEANNVKVWNIDNFPLFFGNVHSSDDINYKPKELTFSPEDSPISLMIFSFKEKLIEEIEKHISNFFILHNFGTRQSKGFGCFLVDGDDTKAEQLLGGNYGVFELNSQELNKLGSDPYRSLFSAIDFFYKSIRSGINQNGVYLKSMMYFYAKDNESYWDKRAIRYKFEHFNPNKNEDKGEEFDSEKDNERGTIPWSEKDEEDERIAFARLYRDMLGLSSSQKWKYYDDTIIKKHQNITRFKSPLTIKPIYNAQKNIFKVFLIPMQIPDRYLNATFDIYSTKKSGSLQLTTPSTFDVGNYLEYIARHKDDVLQRLKGPNGHIIKTTLETIYKNIRYVGRN